MLSLLNLLQYRFGRLEITLMAGDGEMTEEEYQHKVLEALRQMNVQVEEK